MAGESQLISLCKRRGQSDIVFNQVSSAVAGQSNAQGTICINRRPQDDHVSLGEGSHTHLEFIDLVSGGGGSDQQQ